MKIKEQVLPKTDCSERKQIATTKSHRITRHYKLQTQLFCYGTLKLVCKYTWMPANDIVGKGLTSYWQKIYINTNLQIYTIIQALDVITLCFADLQR